MKKPRKARTRLPANGQRAIEHRAEIVTLEHKSWSGPLPSPEDIEAFRRIDPVLPQVIREEWQAEASHRRTQEQRATRCEIIDRYVARASALLFALAALGVAAYCARVGQPWPAGIIGGTTIVAVVTAMLVRK